MNNDKIMEIYFLALTANNSQRYVATLTSYRK